MMRVSNELLANNLVFDVGNELSAIAITQQQLSTGKRVSVPSDDPAAFAQISAFQQQVNQQNVFLGNISSTQSLTDATQTALGSMNNILKRAGVLYAEGTNEVLTATDRQNIVTELNQLIQQAVGIANTNFNGRYLFAGSKIQTQPFVLNGSPPSSVTYQGDGLFVQSQINQNQNINTNIPGNEAFLGGANSFNNVFQALINLRDSFQNSERLSLMPINNPPNPLSYVLPINGQAANFATPPVGPGPNSFTVNGVTINYDTSVDSISSIVAKINSSGANVTARVDSIINPTKIFIQSTNNRLVKLQDVTGNFTQFMQLQDNLQQIQAAQTLVLTDQGNLGATAQQLNGVQTNLQNQNLNLTKSISNLQDANVPQAISNLSLQQTSLQAALQSGAKILQQTNLFNFLQ